MLTHTLTNSVRCKPVKRPRQFSYRAQCTSSVVNILVLSLLCRLIALLPDLVVFEIPDKVVLEIPKESLTDTLQSSAFKALPSTFGADYVYLSLVRHVELRVVHAPLLCLRFLHWALLPIIELALNILLLSKVGVSESSILLTKMKEHNINNRGG